MNNGLMRAIETSTSPLPDMESYKKPSQKEMKIIGSEYLTDRSDESRRALVNLALVDKTLAFGAQSYLYHKLVLNAKGDLNGYNIRRLARSLRTNPQLEEHVYGISVMLSATWGNHTTYDAIVNILNAVDDLREFSLKFHCISPRDIYDVPDWERVPDIIRNVLHCKVGGACNHDTEYVCQWNLHTLSIHAIKDLPLGLLMQLPLSIKTLDLENVRIKDEHRLAPQYENFYKEMTFIQGMAWLDEVQLEKFRVIRVEPLWIVQFLRRPLTPTLLGKSKIFPPDFRPIKSLEVDYEVGDPARYLSFMLKDYSNTLESLALAAVPPAQRTCVYSSRAAICGPTLSLENLSALKSLKIKLSLISIDSVVELLESVPEQNQIEHVEISFNDDSHESIDYLRSKWRTLRKIQRILASDKFDDILIRLQGHSMLLVHIKRALGLSM